MTRKKALQQVEIERFHQDTIHPEGVVDSETSVLLLLEELGEYAKDVNDHQVIRAKDELIQVAALAVRALEELYE